MDNKKTKHYKINKDLILKHNNVSESNFPKYTSQLMNWANQNAQGTRPRVVGQLSELFPEYLSSTQDASVEEWEEWYKKRYPDAIETATERIYNQINNFKNAIKLIDKEMVSEWVHDLVIKKTYTGLYVQKMILSYLASVENQNFTMATPEEESMGIDGYVGDIAYSIKPNTYLTMEHLLPEEINVRMIYYKKNKNDISIDVEE